MLFEFSSSSINCSISLRNLKVKLISSKFLLRVNIISIIFIFNINFLVLFSISFSFFDKENNSFNLDEPFFG